MDLSHAPKAHRVDPPTLPPSPVLTPAQELLDSILAVFFGIAILLGLGLVIGLFNGTTAQLVVAILQLLGYR